MWTALTPNRPYLTFEKVAQYNSILILLNILIDANCKKRKKKVTLFSMQYGVILQITTATRILFVFSLIFKFGK